MIITIDGPAAAGKGTLAAQLSEKYKFAYFDTGMLYRAVGLAVHLAGLNVDDEATALSAAQSLTFAQMIEFSKHPGFRSSLGGQNASIVSAYPSVRSALLKMQQDFALDPRFPDGTSAQGAIYDGRDTGTVVCPNAEIKFFVTASSEIRAERRYKEFVAKGINISYDEVLKDVKARDERDASRTTAPMKPASDAVVFDTSEMSIAEVVKKACEVIDEKIV